MKVILFRDLLTERWWSMERYADELTHALRQIGCDARTYVAARPLPSLRSAPNTFANYAWRTTIYPLAARFHQSDVNHIADHSYAHLIHALDPRRTIVTCHDLAPLALNEGHGIGRRLWKHSFHAMQRAAHIVADSAFTRAEILRCSDYPAERITVVPLAVGAEFFEPISRSDIETLHAWHHLANRKIILHVGTCAPRKNIEPILRAMNDLRDLDVVFVQVGGRYSPAQRDLIASLNLDARAIQLPPLFGDALRAWYHVADIFVFPSLYEGFGMPIIEAMASGVPVVCANMSSLPEVAGDAALLIDPYAPEQLTEAIRSVLDTPVLATDLCQRGLARAQLFTWERTARETLAVYQKIER